MMRMTLLLSLPVIFSAIFAAAPPSSSPGLLLVANKGEHTLGLIDPVSRRQIAAVQEDGITGHEVIASPDGGRAFVPIYGDSGVGLPGTDGSKLAVIDLHERKLINTLDFGHGVRPHCPLIGPKDGLLYVTTELDKSITVIQPKTLKIVGRIPTNQPESHMLAITADGSYAYTANVGPGTVSVLDLAQRKTIAVIPVATHIQRISLSTDDRWAFTSDTQQPRLAVINTSTRKLERWISLPATGYGSAFSKDGKQLLIALPDATRVAAIDLASFRVIKTVDVPAAPQEVLIRPDGNVAYVSCSQSGKVAAIDLNDWSVKLIDAGRGADGLAWAK